MKLKAKHWRYGSRMKQGSANKELLRMFGQSVAQDRGRLVIRDTNGVTSLELPAPLVALLLE